MKAAFASKTRATYNQARKSFDGFRAGQGLPQAWPASEQHIVQYAAFLSLENRSHATARTYIAAIGTFHKLKGWADPTESFLLKKLLQGFARSKDQKDNRLPITYIKLNQLRASKTDQLGIGTKITVLPVRESPTVCPVKAMQAYLAMRPKVTEQLLIHFNGKPLTRFQFQAVLKKAATFLGLDTSRFSSHSFRIGAATTAASNGAPLDVIMKKGRWRSAAVQSYIRLT